MIKFLLSLVFIHLQFNQINGQCAWEYNRTSVTCRLRILEKTGLDLQDAEGTSKLDIECSDSILYESQLPQNIFLKFSQLNELRIDGCKLLQLPSDVFTGLQALKKLRVNTRNYEWGPSKSLEIQTKAFDGLRELQVLDLSKNNLRTVPDSVLCSLNNLQVLNLTENRIRTSENIGFAEQLCNNAGGELQTLDVSYNELRSVTENWGLSKLRRLQQLYLQNNNITEISADALAGLSSLKILNISHNHIETLPIDLFAGTKELREIHLQRNELYELPKGIFHRLEQLLVLDLNGNQLSSHHIDNTTFSGLIRLIILNLAHNALTRIDSRTFKELYFLQILDLRNNSIGHIEENAFLPLYNLHTLNLAENRLHMLDDRLFHGLYVLSKLTLNNNLISVVEANVFKNCSDLKELDLSSNQLTSVPTAIQDLSVLRTLDLGENQISTFENNSFRNLHQLTGLRLIDNHIGNITKGMFSDLPRLSVLNLAKNRIQTIERGSFDKNIEIEAIRLDRNFISDINGVFAALASLLWLNLSENHLVWFDYAFIPSNLKWLDIHGNYIEALGNYYKLQEEIRVKTLDASHNRITEIGPMSVPNSIELLFINNNHISIVHPNTFVDKTNLIRVDLYANALQKLQMHTMRLAPVPPKKSLPEFYLGGNPFECDCSMEWLQRINNLTGRQHPRVMDLPNIECIMPHSRGATVRSLATLHPNDFLCRYDTHCFALCNCCDLEVCDCQMTCPTNCTCYHDQIWSTNVVDCGGKQQIIYEMPHRIPMDTSEVYLDGNNLTEIKNNEFAGRKNMRLLFLNASNIHTIHNHSFAGLTSLQIMHLEDNRLQTFVGHEFQHLEALRELYLQNNLLSYISNETFVPLKSLQILRIDGNRLTSINVLPVQAPNFDSLQALTLGRNSWSCRCKYLQDLTNFVAENAVIIQDSQDIYCTDGTVKRELDFNATSACSDFYSDESSFHGPFSFIYFPLLIAIAITIVLLLLIILFLFREPLRVWLFAQYGVRVFGPRCEESEKLYDAVLLYSPKDAEYVLRDLAVELEMGRPPLRLCLQHRDLMPDASHLQILEAARASRRIILILSRNFLQTEWSRCELRRAVHEALRGRPNKLIVIEEPDVLLEAETDDELVPYLKATTANRIRRSDRHFWEKLRYALPAEVPYRGNNYTLDHQHHQNHMLHHHILHDRVNNTICSGSIKQHPSSPGVLCRQAPPPAYSYPEPDDINYSSATTATPSPRPTRRGIMVELPHNRPPSEHIYSSIDSDYSALDVSNNGTGSTLNNNNNNTSGGASNGMVIGVHRPSWRTNSMTPNATIASTTSASVTVAAPISTNILHHHQHSGASNATTATMASNNSNSMHGHHVQAYLV